jgi:formate--tetrahydrofolate ligase
MDINDRQLRNIVVGLGGKSNGIPRESGFDITAASEIMAILCLANGPEDLKARLGRILIGFTYEGKPVYTGDLRVTGALATLLCDALKPNLVQTLEGQPAFVHGGPFANIAHGNNSILATRLALKTADYTVTEGGFAADLGAEKFFDIVHGYSGLRPDVAVLVASVRALHMHGGVGRADVAQKNLAALEEGLANLKHHVNNMAKYGLPVVVAINRFPSDDAEELAFIDKYCQQLGVASAVCDVVANGGAGGIKLAEVVLDVLANQPSRFQPLYNWKQPIKDKLAILARDIYGANGVTYTANAERDIALCNELGLSELPVCVAKTQHSISDNPALKGVPTNYEITVREVRPAPGAGFLVCLTGDVMTMPGLPKEPAAERIDLTAEGVITGLS